MNYNKLYENIIRKYGSTTKIKEVYQERHHIVPKSVGGNDTTENLVYLPARVHYVCHRVLCKIYPESSKLKFAFWAMCNQLEGDVTREYKVPAGVYAEAKRQFAIVNSKLHKGKKMSPEWCEALGKRMKGNTINKKGPENPRWGVPVTGELKAKISATKLANPERSNMFKGYYTTPQGRFSTSKDAVAVHPTINNITSIIQYCKAGDKVVTKRMTAKGPFTSEDVGKSLRELGWDFEPSPQQK